MVAPPRLNTWVAWKADVWLPPGIPDRSVTVAFGWPLFGPGELNPFSNDW